MGDCAKAIMSLGNYEIVVYGEVTNETEFNNNVKWITGKDSDNQAIFGSKPDAVTWAKVKADMDKQDAFVSQDAINTEAIRYLKSTDWYHQRAADGGAPIPDDIKAKRISERAKIVTYEEFTG
jgi:hypothetical protein|tara:strand:- start:868 stop:1236 length:369 start_codon:yes stop_codon:yes gene_type:complete